MTSSPLIVALDYPAPGPALELVRRLGDAPVGMFKVGSELFTAAGPDLVRHLRSGGHRVFLDLKFHDIPNTVASAVRAAACLGADLLTVHALGGRAMLRAAAEARGSCAGTRVLAVTMLTSMDGAEMNRVGLPAASLEQVLRLAELAAESGLDGVVASVSEAAALRRCFPPPFLLVTPGIRPAWAPEAGDQKRVATPAEARAAGADYLVVGRPITQASDPRGAVISMMSELDMADSV